MLTKIENLLHMISAAFVGIMTLFIVGNVIGRAFLGQTIPDTTIIVPELMVATIVFPLAAATRKRDHISVELFTKNASARTLRFLLMLGSLIGLLAMSPLIYAGWLELEHVLARQSVFFGDLMLPKWPGRALFLLGMAFLWVRLLALFISDLKKLRENSEEIAE